jgi:hypothetical protein
MTKKDYVAIAAAIRKVDNELWQDGPTIQGRAVVADVVAGLAEVMAQDNPRFDRERFAAACGVRS